ncbi:hypothetical protein SAMN05444166_0055 [Singulisphaera sp. GP187]|uniref:hypothetical protein n=1 Tax=Singulisphaera sp. GP187 TaxID=1882752 RepID=UPI000925BBBB|nr:hypothetical protein [Singulisphaera sp. GP187]SIN68095.1 hypothetical protein SAMN05444166_0055 [Singulisphaera sp. GP187]
MKHVVIFPDYPSWRNRPGTYANRLAGKRVDDSLHSIINSIDTLYADLDRAIEIVEDLNSENQRYYKNYYSKFNFAELLKMYVEDWKKEHAHKPVGNTE